MFLELNAEGHQACTECTFINYNPPVSVVALVMPKDDGLVLVLRGEQPGKGKHCLPCGFIDTGEGPVEAAIREGKEETGYDLVVNKLIGYFTDEEKNLIVHIMLCRIVGGSPSEAKKGTDTVSVGVFNKAKGLPPIAFPLHDEIIDRRFAGKILFDTEDANLNF